MKKNIQYLNRDFEGFKQDLINFTKTYFPDTYNDFSETSPGMMFIEMSAYVGDVLSYYLDKQINETFLQFSQEETNQYLLAYLLGYKPKATTPAITELTVMQLLPATGSTGNKIPDYNYTMLLEPNAVIQSTTYPDITFLTTDKVDFSFSSSLSPTDVTVYSLSGTDPTYYLAKKTVKAISAKIKTATFDITDPEQYATFSIYDEKIIGILDCVDSDNNIWYEVDYLAQDKIYNDRQNTNSITGLFSQDRFSESYVLEVENVQRKFTTRFINSCNLELQFGGGVSNVSGSILIPNPTTVGVGLPFEKHKLTAAYNPLNFTYNNSFGIAPSNTTLTVRYLVGGGYDANVPEGDLTVIASKNLTFTIPNLPNDATTQNVYDSLTTINLKAAYGGRGKESIEEIRNNSINRHQSQGRLVNLEDYIIRAYSLPVKYGSIAKAYIEPTKQVNKIQNEKPDILDMYILTYDSNKNLTQTSTTLKENLKTYLSEYRLANTDIRIQDGYIVNIGVSFEILLDIDANSSKVLLKCIQILQDYFNISKWNINQPIYLRELYSILDDVEGVQTVIRVDIENKEGISNGYSQYSYDIKGATKNNIIYPSLNPCIFEVKYPELDIKGRVVTQ